MHKINISPKKMDQWMRWLFLILFLTFLPIVACESANRSTDTYSTNFSQESEKIVFLKKYVKCFSPVSAAEFHIIYHDNSTGLVPGPSDGDLKIVIRIAPSDIPKWTAGFREVEKDDIDLSWIPDIPLEVSRWKSVSRPGYYRRPGGKVEMVVYGKEGVLFKRIRSF